MLTGVQMRIVPVAAVRPHEVEDPARERRIEGRLTHDGMLRDPLLVGAIPNLEDYVLLDGTNRRRALQRLEVPFVLVQVIDYADPHAVDLRTWCHAVTLPMEQIIEGASRIPGVRPTPITPLGAADALADRATLAVTTDGRHTYAIEREPEGAARSQQLRAVVDLYEESMVRVECDPDAIEERAGDLLAPLGEAATLVAFPRFTRGQVVQIAVTGDLIPAGITRHMITGGRALRVNLPLEVLSSGDLDRANETLGSHVAALHPRTYTEPTVLFDS
ncbi:MAG TPA: hypothetical protein VFB58_07375 [Chloroflexota bacterium]|nr:hypothetical protein [Chloroflexota bacterium]